MLHIKVLTNKKERQKRQREAKLLEEYKIISNNINVF